jgi:hypothetical protein
VFRWISYWQLIDSNLKREPKYYFFTLKKRAPPSGQVLDFVEPTFASAFAAAGVAGCYEKV